MSFERGEWTDYVRSHVIAMDAAQQEQAAKQLLDDCLTHGEINEYQAFQIIRHFVDEYTGYS